MISSSLRLKKESIALEKTIWDTREDSRWKIKGQITAKEPSC